MTCIVGIAEAGKVYIGGDSAGVAGWSLVNRRDPKVFRNGPCLFGFSTSFRMGQLLQHALKVPERPIEIDVDQWMVTTFIDAIRNCLKTGGFAQKQSEQEKGGFFLVGYAGRLFEINDDYQVGETTYGYAAVGCAHEIALGAMAATEGYDPERRILLALEAATRHNAAVRPPFTILYLEED